MMASHTQGIQQLLAAEKRAAEVVSEARKRKQKRLKKAKEEAQEEIEKYRQERERQYKDYETKYMGSREQAAAKIEIDTSLKIENMIMEAATNKSYVLKQLLSMVYDIKPIVHKNYLLKKKQEDGFVPKKTDSEPNVLEEQAAVAQEEEVKYVEST